MSKLLATKLSTPQVKMSKLGPKCQYFVWPTLFYSTASTLLGMKFTRASQVATEVLFHSSMMTSQSWWMLETLRSSTFRLMMPHRYSIGFRSGDILGQSITFTLSRISAPVGIVHDWGETLEQGTEPPTAPRAPQCRLPNAPRVCALGWVKCREHISLLVILCIIVYVTNKAHLSLIKWSWSHQITGHGSSNPCP